MEITKNKITEIFCIIDDFCQEYDKEIAHMSICEPVGNHDNTHLLSFQHFPQLQALLPLLCQGAPARLVP